MNVKPPALEHSEYEVAEEELQEILTVVHKTKSIDDNVNGDPSIKVITWLPDAPYLEELGMRKMKN